MMFGSPWMTIGIGAAVVLAAGGIGMAGATDHDDGGAGYTAISPCRLEDSRPASQVGQRIGPLGADESQTHDVHGDNGDCAGIPADAVAIVTNVTAIGATDPSYLTLFPGDADLPVASHLNVGPGQAPTPNAVTVGLSPGGQFTIYNRFGTVHYLVDVVGYYQQFGHEGPARVIVVAESGGDFTSVSDALAAIDGASTSNPYLIRVAPGVYTETSAVVMKDGVDIEGAGRDRTSIICACGGDSYDADSATLGAHGVRAEIRHLTVVNTGGGRHSFGIFTTSGTPGAFSMLHVGAAASGGTSDNSGVLNSSSSPSMTDVIATADGGLGTWSRGVTNFYLSNPMMRQITATGTGGTGSSFGVYNYQSSPTMIDVVAEGVGPKSPAGVANETASSPVMINLHASATGGANSNEGLSNRDASSPSLVNATIIVAGAGSVGISNHESEAILRGSTVTADYGVYNSTSSSVTVMNSIIDGGDIGIHNESSSSAIVRGSAITGGQYSIANTSSTANVAATTLDGTAVGGGFTCVGAHTGAFAPLSATCS